MTVGSPAEPDTPTPADDPAGVARAAARLGGPARTSSTWLTEDEVAAALGIDVAQGGTWLTTACAATMVYVESQRPDLADDAGVFTPTDDVHTAAVLYAMNLYRRRDSGTGHGQLDDLGTLLAVPITDPGIDQLLGIGRYRPATGRVG